jgi:hypothetical protein
MISVLKWNACHGINGTVNTSELCNFVPLGPVFETGMQCFRWQS